MTTCNSVHLIGKSDAMKKIIALAEKVARTDKSVLLIGETGTGKELLANYIHDLSGRSQLKMISVNTAAIVRELIESELFGHTKGAFTGADAERKGFFEAAHGSTLFLDEVDSMPLSAQVKVLRVLEENEITPVGSAHPVAVDVRIIASTKVELNALVEKERFREDLFYRLNIFPITIPPLRQRRDDIPLLVDHFITMFAKEEKIVVEEDAMRILERHSWRGNARELKNIIQRLLVIVKDRITVDDLPDEIKNPDPIDEAMKPCMDWIKEKHLSLEEAKGCLEKNLIEQVLKKTNGNISKAAGILKISFSTLHDKLKKHNIAIHR